MARSTHCHTVIGLENRSASRTSEGFVKIDGVTGATFPLRFYGPNRFVRFTIRTERKLFFSEDRSLAVSLRRLRRHPSKRRLPFERRVSFHRQPQQWRDASHGPHPDACHIAKATSTLSHVQVALASEMPRPAAAESFSPDSVYSQPHTVRPEPGSRLHGAKSWKMPRADDVGLAASTR